MKRIDLTPINHDYKLAKICPNLTPNICEDSIFYADGKPIGFFITKLPDKAANFANIANIELNSSRVPKSDMSRIQPTGTDPVTGKRVYTDVIKQCSAILGSVPPKTHMRRNYSTTSSVHRSASAQTFIKAMIQLAKESESIIHDILPDQYNSQKESLSLVPKKYRFSDLFTSSISNCNISAPFHRDNANIPETVNVIITKRLNSTGGNLFIPDYDAIIDQKDISILVYPAWRNMHAVTPIIPTHPGGYRNSLVFYPLRAFLTK